MPIYPIAIFKVIIDKAVDDFEGRKEGQKITIVILVHRKEVFIKAILTLLSVSIVGMMTFGLEEESMESANEKMVKIY